MDHLEPEKQASDHTGGQTRVRTGEFYPEDVREVLGSFLPEARRSGDFFYRAVTWREYQRHLLRGIGR